MQEASDHFEILLLRQMIGDFLAEFVNLLALEIVFAKFIAAWKLQNAVFIPNGPVRKNGHDFCLLRIAGRHI